MLNNNLTKPYLPTAAKPCLVHPHAKLVHSEFQKMLLAIKLLGDPNQSEVYRGRDVKDGSEFEKLTLRLGGFENPDGISFEPIKACMSLVGHVPCVRENCAHEHDKPYYYRSIADMLPRLKGFLSRSAKTKYVQPNYESHLSFDAMMTVVLETLARFDPYCLARVADAHVNIGPSVEYDFVLVQLILKDEVEAYGQRDFLAHLAIMGTGFAYYNTYDPNGYVEKYKRNPKG